MIDKAGPFVVIGIFAFAAVFPYLVKGWRAICFWWYFGEKSEEAVAQALRNLRIEVSRAYTRRDEARKIAEEFHDFKRDEDPYKSPGKRDRLEACDEDVARQLRRQDRAAAIAFLCGYGKTVLKTLR
jgi:hypothetical protein